MQFGGGSLTNHHSSEVTVRSQWDHSDLFIHVSIPSSIYLSPSSPKVWDISRTVPAGWILKAKSLLQHEAELSNEAGEGEGAEGVDAVHVLQDALLLFLLKSNTNFCKAWRIEPWHWQYSFVKRVSIQCSKWNHEKQAAWAMELEL